MIPSLGVPEGFLLCSLGTQMTTFNSYSAYMAAHNAGRKNIRFVSTKVNAAPAPRQSAIATWALEDMQAWK